VRLDRLATRGGVRASGFSLVEVLISMTLFAVAMLSLPQLFASAARASLEAGRVTMGTLLAAQKIEELRSGPFPRSSASGVELLDSTGATDPVSGSGPAFVRTWSVEPLPSALRTTIAIRVAVSPYRGGHPVTAIPESARLVTLWSREDDDD
jgi:prepilin-type N-terminal cleavage/methylation domain-containing protein